MIRLGIWTRDQSKYASSDVISNYEQELGAQTIPS